MRAQQPSPSNASPPLAGNQDRRRVGSGVLCYPARYVEFVLLISWPGRHLLQAVKLSLHRFQILGDLSNIVERSPVDIEAHHIELTPHRRVGRPVQDSAPRMSPSLPLSRCDHHLQLRHVLAAAA